MTSQPSGENTATPAQRIGWAILILITLYICYFSQLGVIGLVGPDEPRYAWIARDMAETGDWVTPRLYGKPWFEKPVLYYWGAALSFKLFGISEAAARLPSAISAFLATLALAWLAWRTYGEECARWLLLLLPTSVGMIGFSHAAATDMPFAGMLTIAMACAAVVLGLTRRVSGLVLTNPALENENTSILPHTPWLALLLFGFFLGLAVLAKGPAAIILSGGAIFFWAVFTQRWRDALRLLHPAVIASFCLTALPWYILCARRNPDFFRIFIIEHNFKRYLTPEFQHLQPFWYYAVVLLVAFLPWTIAFIGPGVVAAQRVRVRKQLDPASLFLLSTSIFCLVFFTISKSKLPGYVLPAIPSLGLLLARACSVAAVDRSRVARYWAGIAVFHFSFAAVALSFASRIAAATSHSASDVAAALCIICFLFAVANIFLWDAFAHPGPGSCAMRPYAAVGLVLPILSVMLSMNRLMPYFFLRDPSGKTIAQEIRSRGISSAELATLQMNRGAHFSLNFYLQQEIPDWDATHPKDGYVLVGSKGCNEIATRDVACEEPAIHLERSDLFLYRVRLKTSLDRLSGGREPK
jgi:4-amino-4-deoxy-L-arabinose transferase-like glycosyltransferase